MLTKHSFGMLPQEIQDKIFLELGPDDFETLERTRVIQSEYVRQCTQFDNMEEAVKNGNLNNMKWLHSQEDEWSNIWDDDLEPFIETMNIINNDIKLTILKWLHRIGRPFDDNIFTEAVRIGDLNIMKWLHEVGCPFGYDTFAESAFSNNLDNMKWLYNAGCRWITEEDNRAYHYTDNDTFEISAKEGNLDIMKWLYDIGCPFDEDTFSNAVIYGSLDNMKWLHNVGCSWNEQVFSTAVRFAYKNIGQELVIIEWLYVNGCPWDEFTFRDAVRIRNSSIRLTVMKYLHTNGCPWSAHIFLEATKTGNLDCMKWLHVNGCPWDKFTLYYTFVYGNMFKLKESDILTNMKWLYTNGCPLDKDLIKGAINIEKSYNSDIKKWFRSIENI